MKEDETTNPCPSLHLVEKVLLLQQHAIHLHKKGKDDICKILFAEQVLQRVEKLEQIENNAYEDYSR